MSTMIGGGRGGSAKSDGLRPTWDARGPRATVPLAPVRTSARRGALALWLLVYALLNVGDLLSTYLGLRAGLREANPLMSGLLLRHGFAALVAYKLGVILAVVGGALILSRMHPRAAFATLHVCNALVFLAVALNIAQMLLR